MSVNKIAIRTDTAANWTAANPTLVEGEQGHESDTGRRKIGDGSTAWNSLDYIVPVTDIIDTIYPVGAQYTMYAVAASNDASVAFPSDERPDALFGGTWELLWDDEGVFFRTEGAGGRTDVTGGRTDGLQLDQMQRITGDMGESGSTAAINSTMARNGALSASSSTAANRPGYDTDNQQAGISFDSRDSPNARASSSTDGETRPANRLFRIYRRTG